MPKPNLRHLTYNNMGKMKHNGVGHRTGECITVHVVNMLDADAHYKTINGKVHVKDLNIKNGKIVVEKNHIPLTEHNNKHYPQIRSPL